MSIRAWKTKVGVVLATAAMALGLTAAPASADHTCEHRISQQIQTAFGNKNNLVQLINRRLNTNLTVSDLNTLIGLFCATR